VVLGAGALLALAFPEPDVAPLAWIAVAPLLWTIRGGGPGRGFGLGFVFGVGFFSVLLFWISIVGYVAWVLLIILESLFLGLFGALWALLARYRSLAVRVGLAAALWAAIEGLRSTVPLGGFTWGQLAQSQHDLFMWTLRPAAWGGAWLVAALLAAVNALAAEVLAAHGWRRALPAVAAIALLGVPLLLPVGESDGPVLRVAIVQGNVPQDFSGSFYEKELAITRSHAELTRSLDPKGLDLVVWPESSVGLDLQRDPEVRQLVLDAARSLGVPMIVGGNLDVDADRYKVVAFHISPEGEIADIYQKTHLVPFGEYVPGRDLLGWVPMLDQVPRDAVPGAEHKVFELPRASIAPVISFEGDFGSLVRKPLDAGGDLLVVATNTSTWERSWASAQHVAFSQVRAAENNVYVVHAALSGISAFIDPHGQSLERSGLYEATTLVHDVGFGGGNSFYTRTGDWVAYLSVAAVVVGLLGFLRGRRVASAA
jgi:apolipoprotein N-acyltransferase